MKVIFSEHAWEDYLYWQQRDKRVLNRVNMLIKEIQRSPFQGAGKPEPLKHLLAGYWSRRIDEKNRLVYKVEKDALFIIQVRYHY